MLPPHLTKLFVKHLVKTSTITSNRPSGKTEIPREVFISWKSNEPFDINEYRQMDSEFYDSRLTLIERIFQENTPEKKAAVQNLFDGDLLCYLLLEEDNESEECAEKLINMGYRISSDFIDLLQQNINDEWCNKMLQKLGLRTNPPKNHPTMLCNEQNEISAR